MEWFGWFLTQKIDFESQNFEIFTARFLIGRWSAKDLLQWESAIYHSIKLGFEGQVVKKFLNGIYYLPSISFIYIGDSDAVAPMDIAKYLAGNVIPPKVLTGKYLKNVGHFLMLEKPQEWSQIVSDFILNIASVASKVEQATT